MNTYKNICVFCGSKRGNNLSFSLLAQKVGKELARKNIGLVYGGGNIGLMGDIANEMMKYNGKVTGIIPTFMMNKEFANHDISELIIVETMLERKSRMAELSDGFLILPGGIGTMDELFEMWTWVQLGIINKPIGILNFKNYYDDLNSFILKMNENGFVSERCISLLKWSDDVIGLLDEMGF